MEELLIAADIESVDPLLLSDPQPSHTVLQPTASVELFSEAQINHNESNAVSSVPSVPHHSMCKPLPAQQPSAQQLIPMNNQQPLVPQTIPRQLPPQQTIPQRSLIQSSKAIPAPPVNNKPSARNSTIV